ncbi:MAG TPA: pitrilysin family protein [Thermoanaerobaculia bacterium]|nr:pitrilysin family protein [Thermoanaerobaculia bacterium]
MRKLIALLMLVALSAAAQEKKPTLSTRQFDKKQFTIPYEKIVLDNGLTVLVHEDHNVPIVAVNLWYHVGSRNEQRGRTGFAHLFEHFFFNGSENYPHGFREAMDDLGANNRNGTTSTDRTNFFENVPTSALERTLYLEADRMGFLAGNISKEMLERERGVVSNEKRQGENQPYGRALNRAMEILHPYEHPYSWSTIGSLDDLAAASLDDVKEWYRSYYGPNNCVLSLAGDITVARARELALKYFNGIAPGPALARADEWIPKLDRNIRDEMEDRVANTRIYRVYHAPAWKDGSLQHLNLLSEVLAGSKSARLDRRLVYEKGLATETSAYVWDRELGSLFIIAVTLKPGGDAAVVEKEMDAIVREVLENGPTAEEIQRAQSRSLASFVRGIERLGGFGGRSDVLAESMTFGGTPDAYLARLETLATATPADVQKTAKKWLDTNHYTLTVRPTAELKPGKTELDRKVLPSLGAAPAVTFPQVQRATLSNGMKVMLLERHSAPLVNLTLAVDAGHATDAPAKAGLASLTLDLMDEGTATRDTFKISDDLDALGAQLSTTNSLDYSFVDLSALPMHLRASLDILADVVLRPAFPADKVKLLTQQRVSRVRQEQSQPNTLALRLVPRLLYGENHLYGKPFTGTGYVETVGALTRDDVVSWHRSWFHPNRSTMIVTGDVTMEKLVPELERAFGSWKNGDAPKKEISNVARTAGKRVYLIDKPDAPQSVIVAAHVSDAGGTPEDVAVDTVIRNFGGMATSRLNRNLRLDKHWSYGTTGFVNDTRNQRPFIVVAPVQTDKTKEAIVEVQKEIRGVAGERPITGEEYDSVMRSQVLRLPGSFDTLASLTNAAIRTLTLNRGDDYYQKYAANVQALTEADLLSAGKKIVHPDEVIWIIVGDLKKVEAGIRELNLGEIMQLDPNKL